MKRQIAVFLTLFLFATPIFAASLVTTDWLAEHGKDANIVLIDMSDNLQYQRFHLPGAINLPYRALAQLKNKGTFSIDQAQLIKLLGQLGIAQDSYVIVYDDLGGLEAANLLRGLEQLEHPKSALLDGGLVKWIREGRPVAFDEPAVKPVTYIAKTQHQKSTATLKDVAPASRDKNTVLIDVRTDEEYLGDPKIPRSGHIPGAKWWQWDQAIDIEKGFAMRDSNEIMSELSELGLKDKGQPVVVYCQSGHRAAQSYFTLKQLGFKNVRVYDGSMKEYGQHKDLPLTLGKQP